MDSVFFSSTLLLAIFVGGIILMLMYILKLFNTNNETHGNQEKNEKCAQYSEKKKESIGGKTKKKVSESKWSNKTDKQGFTHPWLIKSLKGHTGEVLGVDFSSNNKYLISCADDRTVFIWDFKDITHGEHRSLRVNIEFDYPTFVKWSPDTKAFIIHRYTQNCIEVYKVEKKKDGWLSASKAVTFPKGHEEDVISMDIASNGKYIMTCSNKTDMIIWDLKGNIIAREDTYLMSTTRAKVSPCGKFVAASGFAPDAKVWEIVFNKSGEFQEIKRVFELTGHTSGIYDIAFDVDSSHMATVSKDGTWKLFDTKIEYKKGEDPHLKMSAEYEKGGNQALIALSPNSEVVAIAVTNRLSLFFTHDGKLDETIRKVYHGNITSINFDPSGKYIITTGDRQIRVFHNITGIRRDLQMIEEKLKQNQTAATKERLQQQKTEAMELLGKIIQK